MPILMAVLMQRLFLIFTEDAIGEHDAHLSQR